MEPPRWMGSLNLGSDHAKSNLRVMAELERRAPPNVLTPVGLCKQHAAGLCIGSVVKELDVLCPAYCAAKLCRRDSFYRRFRDAARTVVGARLEWRREADGPL